MKNWIPFLLANLYVAAPLSAQHLELFKNDLERESLNGKVKEVKYSCTCDSVYYEGFYGATLVDLNNCDQTGIWTFNEEGNLLRSSLTIRNAETVESRVYSSSGNISSIEYRTNDSLTKSLYVKYNDLGLIVEETESVDSILRRVVHDYDKNWRLIYKREYENSVLVRTRVFTYSKKNLLKGEKILDHRTGVIVRHNFEYNKFGQVLTLQLDEVRAYYSYSKQGVLLSSTEYWAALPGFYQIVWYDSTGQILRRTDYHSEGLTNYHMEYDHHGNLTQETGFRITRSIPCEMTNYYYDKDADLLCMTSDHLYDSDSWLTIGELYFEYDEKHNWLEQIISSLGYTQTIRREITYF